jgi:hypothetical protein
MGGSPRKRLNEKELGSLYLLSECPLVVDRLLKKDILNDGDVTALHESLSSHAPDMAIIGMSLAGNMLAEKMKTYGRDDLTTLATELKYLSVNTVEEVGRIWIDACRYGVATEDDIHDMVHASSDILCMFTSIFMEIAEAATPEPEIIRSVAGCLMYQAESHADQARIMVDHSNEHGAPSKMEMKDHIPLPVELQNKTYTDNVVMFSLFGEQTRP